MTLEKVIAILADYKELDPASITSESTFEELGLDSLDTVELIMNFEDEFNITIELNEELKTVADIVALIEKSK
jgi:acyl carrier protein